MPLFYWQTFEKFDVEKYMDVWWSLKNLVRQ